MVMILPEVVMLPSNHKSVGYTDGNKAYVRRGFPTAEKEVVIAHERAHILLGHMRRARIYFGKYGKFDGKAWNVAGDMEIARNYYTSEQNITIETSMIPEINTGITGKTCPKCPFDVCEDIYEWLLDNLDDPDVKKLMSNGWDDLPPELKELIEKLQAESDGEDDGELTVPGGIPDYDYNVMTLEKVLEVLRELEEGQEPNSNPSNDTSGVRSQNVTESAKVNLATVIEGMAKSAMMVERSYKRPSRRQDSIDTDLMLKGQKRERKRPKIQVYVDISGSMGADKTEIAAEELDKLLKKYARQLDGAVYYFNDYIHTERKMSSGGNNYGLVMKKVNAERPKMVIIITDDDTTEKPKKLPVGTKGYTIAVKTKATWLAKVIGATEGFIA